MRGHRDNPGVETCSPILLPALQYFNGYDSANDSQDDEEYDEANPTLFACRSCRGDSLFRIAKAAKVISHK
jgi:hypothetical protein